MVGKKKSSPDNKHNMGQLKLSNSKLNSVLNFICEILVNSVWFCKQRSGFGHWFINQRTAEAVQGLSCLDILKCHSRLLQLSWKCVVTEDTGKEVWQTFLFLFCFNIFIMLVFLLSLKLFFFEKHLLLVGEKQKAETFGGILSTICRGMRSRN